MNYLHLARPETERASFYKYFRMKEDNQRKAYLFALAAVLFWSTIAVAFKLGLHHLDPWQMVFSASLVSFLFFTGLNLFRRGPGGMLKGITRRNILSSALLGFLNPFLYYIILIHAYDMISAQEAMTLNYIWPVMLALLSVPLLGQRMGLLSFVAMVISFAGIILIATKGVFAGLVISDLTGDILAAGSSLVWALYWILNLRDHREIPDKMQLNFLFGTLYAFVALVLFSDPFSITAKGWISGIYLGVFEMGLTFLLWLTALKFSRKTYLVSQLIFISPFLGLIWIRIVLKEPILPVTLAGLVLIIAGILLQQQHESRRAAKSSKGG